MKYGAPDKIASCLVFARTESRIKPLIGALDEDALSSCDGVPRNSRGTADKIPRRVAYARDHPSACYAAAVVSPVRLKFLGRILSSFANAIEISRETLGISSLAVHQPWDAHASGRLRSVVL